MEKIDLEKLSQVTGGTEIHEKKKYVSSFFCEYCGKTIRLNGVYDLGQRKQTAHRPRSRGRCAVCLIRKSGAAGGHASETVTRRVPISSTWTQSSSPAFSQSCWPSGRPRMTPAGVPVRIRSPGSSVQQRERKLTITGTE